MLVEEGFTVNSVDASDKMLKYALKTRWNRRREPNFDKWGEYKIIVLMPLRSKVIIVSQFSLERFGNPT